MLKLPKGLKKKKKGKKSKKDQELFTEEELEQYKKEHQLKQVEGSESEPNASTTVDRKNSVEDNSLTACANPAEPTTEGKGEQDEEWSKFKALTAGVDSILHRTQDDLDRIKSTSFYQRVPTTAEKEKLEREVAAAREAEKQEKERLKKLEEEANRDKLAEAVVELSESEEESEEVDDIFNTEYIDAITSGEIQLAIVPDSPIFEVDDGPDPFDTAYADKLIKGPEVSSRGKKLVCIGSAVEVLTGRVDSAHAIALSGAKRKPRKGIQNLLLENEEDAALVFEEFAVTPAEPTKTLLDDFDEDIPDIPIDLSISLHLPLLKQQEKKTEETNFENEENQFNTQEVVLEFDVLKYDEFDEFAELAAESLTKKEEVAKIIINPQVLNLSQTVEANWAEFEHTDNEKKSNNTQIKVKPPRPPPARPTSGPQISVAQQVEQNEDNFEIPEDDPFDTAFVEKVISVNNDEDDDFDFDPRAGEEQSTINSALTIQKDLLGGSSTNISSLGQAPLKPVQDSFEEIDPFDTSAIANLVKPKEIELKFIEKELLADQNLHKSLSDPDFDPREDENLLHPQIITTEQFDSAQRKSSLSLNLQSKSVGFLIPENDVFALDNETGKNQKPLTPYYAKSEAIEEKEIEDPFDTTFVSNTKLSDIELKHIESDLLANSNLTYSLSDPDFNPRADDNIVAQQSDLLAVEDNINIKVLTPALEKKELFTEKFADPFDTSIASNIKPGKTELKLLENELLPPSISEVTTGVLDSLTDAQELGLGDKVLTPQAPILTTDSLEEVDPFDTSFASNLGPGKTEIKILENELIEN